MSRFTSQVGLVPKVNVTRLIICKQNYPLTVSKNLKHNGEMKIALSLSFLFLSTFANAQNPIREYGVVNEHRLLSEFVQLLSIPNIACDAPNIRKNADYL